MKSDGPTGEASVRSAAAAGMLDILQSLECIAFSLGRLFTDIVSICPVSPVNRVFLEDPKRDQCIS